MANHTGDPVVQSTSLYRRTAKLFGRIGFKCEVCQRARANNVAPTKISHLFKSCTEGEKRTLEGEKGSLLAAVTTLEGRTLEGEKGTLLAAITTLEGEKRTLN